MALVISSFFWCICIELKAFLLLSFVFPVTLKFSRSEYEDNFGIEFDLPFKASCFLSLFYFVGSTSCWQFLFLLYHNVLLACLPLSSEFLGRKFVIMTSSVTYIVGAVVVATSYTQMQIVAGRFITGLSLGQYPVFLLLLRQSYSMFSCNVLPKMWLRDVASSLHAHQFKCKSVFVRKELKVLVDHLDFSTPFD